MKAYLAGLSLITTALFACGGTTDTPTDGGDTDAGDQDVVVVVDAGPDVDNGQPSTTYPAFKVDPPQVVNSGGSTLAAPKVVPIYYSNDDATFTGNITSFLNKLPASTYWGPSVVEYGVGALSIATPVQLTTPAPLTISDDEIQAWLTTKLASSDPAFPAPDANTIYTFFFPTGTTITLSQQQGGGSSCKQFGGYHDNVVFAAKPVAYAVVPRCATFGGLTGLDAVTGPSTHEIIEAATDPYPQDSPAYQSVDDNHILWTFILGGGETGDLCAQFSNAFFIPTDVGNTVQRTWSNKAAKAGHDPCQPADGSAYFNSMPVLPETVTLGGQITTKGITIPVGGTGTVEVDLFSDADTKGPWTVKATDAASLQGAKPTLDFTWDKTSGLNGEKLHLTITVLGKSQYGAAAFILDSVQGPRTSLWVGLVAN